MRVVKETINLMRRDFRIWTKNQLVPLLVFLLITAVIIASAFIVAVLMAAFTPLGGDGILITILIVGITQIFLAIWSWGAYKTAAKNVKKENDELLRNIKHPKPRN